MFAAQKERRQLRTTECYRATLVVIFRVGLANWFANWSVNMKRGFCSLVHFFLIR